VVSFPAWVWLLFHSCLIFPTSPHLIFSKWYQSRWFVMVTDLDEYNLIPVSKVFLIEVLRGSVSMWKRDSHLRGDIVRYSSVSLSLTLSGNEKAEQHIRKKTHRPNALRFSVEGGVIPLGGSDPCLILVSSPRYFCPRFSNKWY